MADLRFTAVLQHKDHVELVDMPLPRAPSMLNRPASEEHIPLVFAATYGRETMASHLLRMGAKQPVKLDETTTCPLKVAVIFDHSDFLRILLDHEMDAADSKEVIRCAFGVRSVATAGVRTSG